MAHATKYPPADKTTQWRGDRPTMATVNKVLWHTTETSGWPGYPDFAPNLTYNPWSRKWRQHYNVNDAATTLADKADTDDYHPNRQNVCQVEIVAYCDPARSSSPAHISRISDAAYGDLAAFFHWLSVEWDVPLVNYPNWLPYPQSYGSTSIRMSRSEFTAFKGACGHQHAPENNHGDPGALKVSLILSKARALAGGDDDMPTAKEIAEAVGDHLIKDFKPGEDVKLETAIRLLGGRTDTVEGSLAEIKTALEEIKALVTPTP